jgi:hypothetical protein
MNNQPHLEAMPASNSRKQRRAKHSKRLSNAEKVDMQICKQHQKIFEYIGYLAIDTAAKKLRQYGLKAGIIVKLTVTEDCSLIVRGSEENGEEIHR